MGVFSGERSLKESKESKEDDTAGVMQGVISALMDLGVSRSQLSPLLLLINRLLFETEAERKAVGSFTDLKVSAEPIVRVSMRACHETIQRPCA